MDTSNACEVLTAQNNHQIFLGRPSLSRLFLFLLLDCPLPQQGPVIIMIDQLSTKFHDQRRYPQPPIG